MKIIMLVFLLSFSFQIQAACKCNCALMDRRICASNYDLDKPCTSICRGATPGVAPMITACPIRKSVDLMTGQIYWTTDCGEGT